MTAIAMWASSTKYSTRLWPKEVDIKNAYF
jgi:hypothetical protein